MNISLPLNASNSSSTPAVPLRGTVLVVVELFIFLVLNIAAFVGNLLVCMAFYRNPSLRTVTNNFILSLALTDLLMAVVVMPGFTVSSLLNRWIAGETISQIIFCFLMFSLNTSLSNVMLLAMNRYFRVVRPALYGNIYSKKSSAVMVAATWIVTLALVGVGYPLSLEVGSENSQSNPMVNQPRFLNKNLYIYSTIIGSFYVGVSSFVVVICYVKIYQAIRQHNTAAAPSTQEGNSPYGVEEAKITRLLTAVVVGFYLCYSPAYITTFFIIFNLLPSAAYSYLSFMRLFPTFTSSVINPIVYGVMNQSFRSEFVKLVRCRR